MSDNINLKTIFADCKQLFNHHKKYYGLSENLKFSSFIKIVYDDLTHFKDITGKFRKSSKAIFKKIIELKQNDYGTIYKFFKIKLENYQQNKIILLDTSTTSDENIDKIFVTEKNKHLFIEVSFNNFDKNK